MRIGIDMLAVQSPYSRGRGIGRYAANLLDALLDLDTANEYLLYAYEDLPTDLFPSRPNVRPRAIRRDPERGETTFRDAVERTTTLNPDGLDAYFILSPFELWGLYGPPTRPLNGPRMVAVLYDLIPFVFQEKYLTDAWAGPWFYGHIERLRRYDALLAISEATRLDGLRLTGLPADRIVTIGGASDGRFFVPDRSEPMPAASRAVLDRLGIDRAFVYCLASMDDRKNLRGLIDAFRLLPEDARRRHRLVVGCAMTEDEAARVRGHAEEVGIADALVLTGELVDAELRVLYQRCAAFAFPSLYEGLGLPLLEAMHCGAAVVAGGNSSQPEVVGDAGLLVNAHDPADIAAKLARLLTDPEFAARLGRLGEERAAGFRWDRVASRALEELTRPTPRPSSTRLRVDRGHAVKPRIAMFSPYPPKGSGIADYSVRLVRELERHATIDLYHDGGYAPDLGFQSASFGCHEVRQFDRHAAWLDYHGIVYHMGNSCYHASLYETFLRHPGVVVLHDFNLAGFHYWHGPDQPGDPDHFLRELEFCYPDRYTDLVAQLPAWADEPGGIPDACARRGLHLNRRIFERATRVIVHSDWCMEQLAEQYPHLVGRAVVVPFGASVHEITPKRRAAVRSRFDLPESALVFASFGILHPIKMNVETIAAFAPLARAMPSARLVFVGEDLGSGEARAMADRLGLSGQVRFLGRQSGPDYLELLAMADVGICLRRPPTNGETSASLLDLLRSGLPTIVADVATFSDFPDDVVHKVRWEDDRAGLARLAIAIHTLAGSPTTRDELGRSAMRHVREHHAWSRSAARYIEVIEACAAERTRARRSPTPRRERERLDVV